MAELPHSLRLIFIFHNFVRFGILQKMGYQPTV